MLRLMEYWGSNDIGGGFEVAVVMVEVVEEGAGGVLNDAGLRVELDGRCVLVIFDGGDVAGAAVGWFW